MKTSFGLPSYNFTIVLSEFDIQQLLERGYIAIVPRKTDGIFVDAYRNSHDRSGYELMCADNKLGEFPIQFLGIALEKDPHK